MRVCMMGFGAYDVAVALTEALSARCQIDFYCSRYHLEDGDPALVGRLEGKAGIFCYGNHRYRDPRNLFVYRQLCRDIRRREYDVVHFQVPASPWMAPSWRSRRMPPLVVTVHDPDPHPGASVALTAYELLSQRLFIPKAGKLIVHGRQLRKRLLEKYPKRSPGDIHVLPLGELEFPPSEVEPLNASTKNGRQNTLLFFGRICPYKGLEYLFKAEPLISAKTNGFRIVVAGQGDMSAYLAHAMNPSRWTLLNRYIPNDEVARLFQNASLVVLPYTSATQSGVIPIAYSFGKPVVATNVGSIPEVVENGRTGLLVDPRNEVSLAEAITTLLTNDRLREQMGRNALEYCRRHLSWDAIATSTMEIYEEVISRVPRSEATFSHRKLETPWPGEAP